MLEVSGRASEERSGFQAQLIRHQLTLKTDIMVTKAKKVEPKKAAAKPAAKKLAAKKVAEVKKEVKKEKAEFTRNPAFSKIYEQNLFLLKEFVKLLNSNVFLV